MGRLFLGQELCSGDRICVHRQQMSCGTEGCADGTLLIGTPVHIFGKEINIISEYLILLAMNELREH